MLLGVSNVVLFWRFDFRLKKHDACFDFCEGQKCSLHFLSDILCPKKQSDQQDSIRIMLRVQKCLILCAHKQKEVHKHEHQWSTSI